MEYSSISDDLIAVKEKGTCHRPPSSSASSTSSGGEDSSLGSEDEDMANCLMLLARGTPPTAEVGVAGAGRFECKTCFRIFPSSQALGGHRTSHKKQKIVTAETDRKRVSEQRFVNLNGNHSEASKSHECMVCGSEFASGQALGGHMRRHRPPPGTNGKTISSGVKSEVFSDAKEPEIVLVLDLNLPAPPDEDHSSSDQGFAAAAAMAADCYC